MITNLNKSTYITGIPIWLRDAAHKSAFFVKLGSCKISAFVNASGKQINAIQEVTKSYDKMLLRKSILMGLYKED